MSPTAKLHSPTGMFPLEDPIAGLAIEARLNEERERDSAQHKADRSDTPARFIASDALRCARQVAFGRLEVPKDIKYDQAQLMTFRAGDFYHQIAQESLVQWVNARCEVDYDWRPTFSLYGRADAVYDEPARTVVEIKSQAGYGFDLSTGARKSSDGPGPKLDHLVQAGFAAMCPEIEAERVHVVYINKDRGAVAEWVIGLDEPLLHAEPGPDGEPATIRALVRLEMERLTAIGGLLDKGVMPPRSIPGIDLYIEDPPANGSRGKPWQCAYCSWQPSCVALPMDSFPYVQREDDKRIEQGALT